MAESKPFNSQCLCSSIHGTPGEVRMVRQLPPAHCMLKVDSFSSLQETLSKTNNDKFESFEFVSGGYTWVLSVYPEGNKEENGKGHLSLYIRVVEKLNAGNFINATIRFLVYDQIRDNYLVIQDLRERRFHALKKEWGVSRALELPTFHDNSKGYLMNDCCILGAEVFVIKSEIKVASFSIVKPQTIRKFTWKTAEQRDIISSPNFEIEGRQWQLTLYPRGFGNNKGRNLSLYLWLNDASDLIGGRLLYIEFQLSVKNQFKGDDHKKTVGCWFSSGKNAWGSANLLPLTELDDPSKGFKVNEAVIVEANINLMFLLKDA